MMDIATYLQEVEYAATETIRLVWFEREQLENLEIRVRKLKVEVEDAGQRLNWLGVNPEFDVDNDSTALYWDTYFGPAKDLFYEQKGMADLGSLIEARKFSTNAQSAALLQYAKQGISLAHHGLEACPAGRSIGSQSLKVIIWQGRNQALHWDERRPKRPVRECFRTLGQDIDPKFGDFEVGSLAGDIVELLGWRTFDSFKVDMLSFKPITNR
jgi:hypothetical protein